MKILKLHESEVVISMPEDLVSDPSWQIVVFVEDANAPVSRIASYKVACAYADFILVQVKAYVKALEKDEYSPTRHCDCINVIVRYPGGNAFKRCSF